MKSADNAYNHIRIRTVLTISDIVGHLCHFLGKGGTSFPGLVALKLYPGILHRITEGIKVILVTGTNGKTTTVHMTAHMMDSAGISCVYTSNGENIGSSIATVFMKNYDRHQDRPAAEIAIIECDSGCLSEMIRQLNPVCVTITNISSDQTDCLGNPDEMAQSIKKSLENHSGNVCIDSNNSYSLEAVTDLKPEKTVKFFYSKDTIYIQNRIFRPVLNIPGRYNMGNAAAAIASLISAGVFKDEMPDSLKSLPTIFGRMEKLVIEDTEVRINLAKNIEGVSETLEYIAEEESDIRIVLGFNDNIADGVDLSWLEKVDWDSYRKYLSDTVVYAADSRTQLKYLPSFLQEQDAIHNPDELLKMIKESDKPVFMIINYTCMMSIRKELAKKNYVFHFWEK